MSKSLRHYKRHGNKTQRRRKGRKARKMTGGNEFDGNNLHEFKELMNQNDRQLVALHSDEECTHCNQFKPEWDKVLDRLPPQPDMTVAKLGPDVTDYMNEHHYRKHNHSVNGVPTIIYYIANNKPQEYDGERTADKIIAWLTQVMAEHNMELTIKPKSQEGELGEEPAPSDLDAPFAPPLDLAAEPMEQEPAQLGQLEPVSQEPLEDAFPQSPLPPASTLSKATETIKATAAKVDEKIEQGVTALKSALTSDLGSLFSSSSETNAATTTPAPALAPPALAPANNHVDVFPPPPPPLVNGSAVAAPLPPPPPSQNLNPNLMNGQTTPSVVGGVRRKFTRRRSKKSKKSKSSRKSRKTKKSNRSKQ